MARSDTAGSSERTSPTSPVTAVELPAVSFSRKLFFFLLRSGALVSLALVE